MSFSDFCGYTARSKFSVSPPPKLCLSRILVLQLGSASSNGQFVLRLPAACSVHQNHGAMVALRKELYVRGVVFSVVVEELITHIVDCDLKYDLSLSPGTAFGSKWSYMASSSALPLYSWTIPYSYTVPFVLYRRVTFNFVAPTLLVPNLKTHAPPTPYLPKKALGAESGLLCPSRLSPDDACWHRPWLSCSRPLRCALTVVNDLNAAGL